MPERRALFSTASLDAPATNGDREAPAHAGFRHCHHHPPSSVSWATHTLPSQIEPRLTVAPLPQCCRSLSRPCRSPEPADADDLLYTAALCPPPSPLTYRLGEPSPPPPHQARWHRLHGARTAVPGTPCSRAHPEQPRCPTAA
jgi:hypothetical protein